MDYILHILILVGIYAIVAASLNVLAGYTGLLTIAHAAFYGIGAYVVALMGIHWGTPFWFNVPCAMVVAGTLAFTVSLPALRVHDDYFVLATFALQVIITNVLTNWVSFTGGPMGLPGIPPPSAFGLEFTSGWAFLVLVILFAAGALIFCHRLVSSPFGRVLRAIREDELFAESLGKNVRHFKVLVSVLASSLVAVGGALYASYISYIDPSGFAVNESIFMLAIVIVGGVGSLRGSVVGALVLVTLPEILRFAGFPSSMAAHLRQIVYGGLLIAVITIRPRGILGRYEFGR